MGDNFSGPPTKKETVPVKEIVEEDLVEDDLVNDDTVNDENLPEQWYLELSYNFH